MGSKDNNWGLGNRTKLSPITTNTTTTVKRKKILKTKTRTMKISESTYELLRNHSSKFHDQVMSYDEIIEELCNYWNENHEQKWFLS